MLNTKSTVGLAKQLMVLIAHKRAYEVIDSEVDN